MKCVDVAGKELFMTDHSLDDSDVKFLEEGNAAAATCYIVQFSCYLSEPK